MLNKHSQMLLKFNNKLSKCHFRTSQNKADSYTTQQEFDIVTRVAFTSALMRHSYTSYS